MTHVIVWYIVCSMYLIIVICYYDIVYVYIMYYMLH